MFLFVVLVEDVLASDDFPFSKKIGAKKLRKLEEKERQKEAREVSDIVGLCMHSTSHLDWFEC